MDFTAEIARFVILFIKSDNYLAGAESFDIIFASYFYENTTNHNIIRINILNKKFLV